MIGAGSADSVQADPAVLPWPQLELGIVPELVLACSADSVVGRAWDLEFHLLVSGHSEAFVHEAEIDLGSFLVCCLQVPPIRPLLGTLVHLPAGLAVD